MSNFTTELIKNLSNNVSVEEIFRAELEKAFNQLLETELACFLGYEKYSKDGYNTGDSRNGYYKRTFQTKYGELNLSIPRDRAGEFKQQTLPSHARSDDSLEQMVILMYSKGVTTREIAELIEKMYGHYYSPQTISNITQTVQEQVSAFHNRSISKRFVVLYCDATYLNVRRDSVEKEALHIIMGITEDGTREVLDYALYPQERAENYAYMLHNLKERGLEQILLFVTDGLTGIREELLQVFPKAKHQTCWAHLARNVMKYVRAKDKLQVMQDFKRIHEQKNAEDAMTELVRFCEKYGKVYPKLVERLSDVTSFFSFYDFPESIRPSIYTTNLIENFNKQIKSQCKKKVQFPNEASLERFICGLVLEYNREGEERIHRGFSLAQPQLTDLFS